MANFLKGKEGRNSLSLVVFLGILAAVLLALPYFLTNSYKYNLEANLDGGEVFGKDVNLLFVGDIMLSRGVGNIMERTNNWRFPFLETADFLKEADLTMGNLEGPISSGGADVGGVYSFRADPRAIEGLLYAGVDVLSLANNHIWDYGPQAFIDTIELLKGADISPVGGRLNYERAYGPVVKKVGNTEIAYLAYTNLVPVTLSYGAPAVAFLDPDIVVSDVRVAKSQADIVIVSVHWGDEYETKENDFQKSTAHALIDAGADIIVGHHPHVIQPLEQYGNGFIAYSLGNFVFDQNFSEDTKEGAVLKVVLKNKKIYSVKELKVKFNESYQPFLVES